MAKMENVLFFVQIERMASSQNGDKKFQHPTQSFG